MSHAAARDGFETFLRAAMDTTRSEFRVGRTLRGTGLGPGGMVIDRLRENADELERRLVEPELASYRADALAEFDVIMAYAESDRPIEDFEEACLAHNSYVEALKPTLSPRTREAVIADILDRNRRLGDGLAPIIERPEDEFWAATQAAFDRSEAIELVEEAFPFTTPVRQHRDAFVFEARIDPDEIVGGLFGAGLPSVSLDYTDEALRAMSRAERQVIEETKSEIRTRFE